MSTEHFKDSEFKCHCGCGIQNISQYLLQVLETIRAIVKIPLVINSGCRCPTYNAHEGGAPDSAHITTPAIKGTAADVKCLAPRTRYKIMKAALGAGVNRIGIGPDFIHIDVSLNNDPEVIWDYYPKTTGGTDGNH